MGYPARIKEVCNEFKTYGLNCTESKSGDPVNKIAIEAQEIADLALKL
jgi:hypothetical protein